MKQTYNIAGRQTTLGDASHPGFFVPVPEEQASISYPGESDERLFRFPNGEIWHQKLGYNRMQVTAPDGTKKNFWMPEVPKAPPSFEELLAAAPDGPTPPIVGVDWGSGKSLGSVQLSGGPLPRHFVYPPQGAPPSGLEPEVVLPAPQPMNIQDGMDILMFDGHPIYRRKSDGYWGATSICWAAGKRWDRFMYRKATDRLFTRLRDEFGGMDSDFLHHVGHGQSIFRGAWVHKEIALELAEWCRPALCRAMVGWLDELLKGGQQLADKGLDYGVSPAHLQRLIEAERKPVDGQALLDKLAGLKPVLEAMAGIKEARQAVDAACDELLPTNFGENGIASCVEVDEPQFPVTVLPPTGAPPTLDASEWKDQMREMIADRRAEASTEEAMTAAWRKGIEKVRAENERPTSIPFPVVPSDEFTQIQTLLPVDTSGEDLRVNARDLHAFLQSGQKFTDWVDNRAADCQLVENEDYGVCFINLGSKECGVKGTGRGGHNAKEYWLTLDTAKELSMMERNDQGKRARRYFIACEKQLRALKPALPQTFAEALRLLADTTEEADRLRLENSRAEKEVKLLGMEVEQQTARAEVAQLKEQEAKRDLDLVLPWMAAPKIMVTLETFFQQTSAVHGLTSATGYAYLVDTGVISKGEMQSNGQLAYTASEEQQKAHRMYNKPGSYTVMESTHEGAPAAEVTHNTKTVYLIPDLVGGDGVVIRKGGYTWLCETLVKDVRTTLARMIRDEPENKELYKLYGCLLKRVPEITVEMLMEVNEDRIFYSKEKLPDGSIYYTTGRNAGSYTTAGGATLELALRRLAVLTPDTDTKALSSTRSYKRKSRAEVLLDSKIKGPKKRRKK